MHPPFLVYQAILVQMWNLGVPQYEILKFSSLFPADGDQQARTDYNRAVGKIGIAKNSREGEEKDSHSWLCRVKLGFLLSDVLLM